MLRETPEALSLITILPSQITPEALDLLSGLIFLSCFLSSRRFSSLVIFLSSKVVSVFSVLGFRSPFAAEKSISELPKPLFSEHSVASALTDSVLIVMESLLMACSFIRASLFPSKVFPAGSSSILFSPFASMVLGSESKGMLRASDTIFRPAAVSISISLFITALISFLFFELFVSINFFFLPSDFIFLVTWPSCVSCAFSMSTFDSHVFDGGVTFFVKCRILPGRGDNRNPPGTEKHVMI
uniref:Uncharacterized protein n=1 Tax=Arundo donax TaxID=35708 RepID=A0A0A9DIT7_ARUDO